MFYLLKIFLGGFDNGDRTFKNMILEYNPKSEQWQQVGTMKEARSSPGLSVVSYKDYADWCV